ncbi:hypothetical protein RRG08_015749 [Elysia crispata]|uniref:Uncharacterized protein n=1 Tax=Elysia crispata TaxID=231223 RepID=A0AAE0YSE1_9GAST|nr:hypothetical protein RRG08_015749 [Elysia crispata]
MRDVIRRIQGVISAGFLHTALTLNGDLVNNNSRSGNRIGGSCDLLHDISRPSYRVIADFTGADHTRTMYSNAFKRDNKNFLVDNYKLRLFELSRYESCSECSTSRPVVFWGKGRRGWKSTKTVIYRNSETPKLLRKNSIFSFFFF